MSRTIPFQDAQFMGFAQNLQQQCVQNQAAWNLDAASVAELTALTTAAAAAYAANLNPETKNHATATAKSGAFEALRHALSVAIGALHYNTAVTNDELKAMGLPTREHHAHQPIPAPTQAPQVSIKNGNHAELLVYVDTPSYGHPDHAVTSPRYHGFVLQWRYSDDTDWHSETSTSSHVVLSFDERDTAREVTMQAAWVNPRMQRGPWCKPVTAVVT